MSFPVAQWTGRAPVQDLVLLSDPQHPLHPPNWWLVSCTMAVPTSRAPCSPCALQEDEGLSFRALRVPCCLHFEFPLFLSLLSCFNILRSKHPLGLKLFLQKPMGCWLQGGPSTCVLLTESEPGFLNPASHLTQTQRSNVTDDGGGGKPSLLEAVLVINWPPTFWETCTSLCKVIGKDDLTFANQCCLFFGETTV